MRDSFPSIVLFISSHEDSHIMHDTYKKTYYGCFSNYKGLFFTESNIITFHFWFLWTYCSICSLLTVFSFSLVRKIGANGGFFSSFRLLTSSFCHESMIFGGIVSRHHCRFLFKGYKSLQTSSSEWFLKIKKIKSKKYRPTGTPLRSVSVSERKVN
jgi:hypothetical protein